MLRHRPALRAAALLIGGILLSESLALHPLPLWWLFTAAWCGAAVLTLKNPRSPISSVCIHASVILLAASWTAVREADLATRRVAPDRPENRVRMTAILEEAPVRQGSAIQFVLIGDSLEADGRAQGGGRFLAFLSAKKAEDWLQAGAGQGVEVGGTFREFPRPRNPGEFDYGRYLSLKNIRGIISIDSIRGAPAHGISVRSRFAALRATLSNVLARHHGPVEAGFLQGVVFGDRKDISPELKESFMNTGTIHILAVSGSNVALIAMMLYLLLGLLRFPKRAVVVLTLIGLFLYMMITGAESSIVRATIMGAVIVVGTAMERRTDVINSVAVAAMIVLLIDPLQLFDVGFQLSFAAVLSIILLYPRLEHLIDAIPEPLEEVKLLNPVWKLFAVSAAAQLGTLPFTAFYFERISLVSFAANIIVVPLVGVNLILACMTIAAEAVSTWIASVYAALNEVLVDVLLGFVSVAAQVPFATLDTYGIGVLSALLYYAALFMVFNLHNVERVKAGMLLCGTILSVMVYDAVLRHSVELRVIMLDIGQGDAVLVEFPNGARMLVDAGPRTFRSDAGERTVVPYLARRGIGRIDAALISHAHSDHIGGLETVIGAMDVGVIYEPDTVTGSAMHARLRAKANEKGIPLKVVNAGADISPDPSVRLYVLHPPPGHGAEHDLNNGSLVLKLVYDRTAMLLTGDVEEEAEQMIRSRYGGFLDSDVLKVGHHGSITSSSPDFLNGITPEIALISVGTGNTFGHPSSVVLERLAQKGAAVLRTDREGAVIVATDGSEWKRIEWYHRTDYEQDHR